MIRLGSRSTADSTTPSSCSTLSGPGGTSLASQRSRARTSAREEHRRPPPYGCPVSSARGPLQLPAADGAHVWCSHGHKGIVSTIAFNPECNGLYALGTYNKMVSAVCRWCCWLRYYSRWHRSHVPMSRAMPRRTGGALRRPQPRQSGALAGGPHGWRDASAVGGRWDLVVFRRTKGWAALWVGHSQPGTALRLLQQ